MRPHPQAGRYRDGTLKRHEKLLHPVACLIMSGLLLLSLGARAETATAEQGYLLALYKHLHTNPELSFHEQETSARIAKELGDIGFEVTAGVGGFGVVAVMKNGPGPTLLLRTDMDALPVQEQTGLPYASKTTAVREDGTAVPVMHACGHDLHMTVFVGTARRLSSTRDAWKGTLVLVAQPKGSLALVTKSTSAINIGDAIRNEADR